MMNKVQITLLYGLIFTAFISNAQGYKTEMTITQDGSGDFTSIQATIDAPNVILMKG